MGNTLDKPKTDKDTSVGSDSQDGLSWGVSSMQGWRLSMEDAHICAPSKYEEKLTLDDSSSDAADGATSMDTNGIRLQVQQANQNDNDKAKATKNPSSSKDKSIDEEPQQINKDHKATNPEEQDSLQLPPHHYFFCVLDGHGGDFAAHYGRDNLLPILLEQDSFQEYEKLIWKATTTLTSSLEESSTKFGGKKRKQAGHPKNKNQANRNHPRQLKKDRNVLERQSLLLQRALEDAFVELDLLLLHEMVQQKMVLVPPLAVDTADMDDTIIMDDDWGTYDRMEEDTTTTSTTTSNSQNANGDTIPGTTAVAVLVTPDWILCANLGDSRASLLLSSYPKSKVQSSSPQQHASNKKKNKQKEHNKNKKKDGAAYSSRVDDLNSSKSEADYWTIVALSEDHKPDLPEEQARIEAANGNVTMGGRVDGELAVSRAFGDFGFKEAYPRDLYSGERIQNRRSSRRRRRIQSKLGESNGLNDSLDADNQEEGMDWERQRAMAQQLKVSPFPEVFAYPRHRGKDDRTDDSNHGQEKVLLLGCDGVWDVMTNENCHSLVQELLLEGETNMGLIAEEILDTCLKKGSRDNMSIIVIHFADTSVSSSGTDKSHTISGGGGGGGVLKRRKQRNSADRGS